MYVWDHDFHGYEPMAVLFSFQSEFLVRRDAVWNSIVVNEAFQNPTHGNAGRSSAGRVNCCPFVTMFLEVEPYPELGFNLCCWQVGHSCCVANWLLEPSSSIAVLWLAFTWAQILHSCSVSILRGPSTYLSPDLLVANVPTLFVPSPWPLAKPSPTAQELL